MTHFGVGVDMGGGDFARRDDHRGLFDAAPCAMMTVDDAECITDANSLAVRLFASPREGLLGRPVASLLAPKDRDRLRVELRANGPPTDVHVHAHVGTRALELVISMGRVGAVDAPRPETLLLFRDATPIGGIGNDCCQSTKMDALGRLAGGIAHDFNTALTGIAGCADVALRHVADDDPAREYIVEIKAAAIRASAMPRRLLDFSRRRVTVPSVFDQGALVTSLEPALGRIVGERVSLDFTPAVEPMNVCCEENQMAQLIVHLVTNARDAIEDEGRISVTLEGCEVGRSSPGRLRLLPPGPYVCLQVADSGKGMDDATLAQAFEPFFSTKDRARDAGLGLTMVANTVETARGHIETVTRTSVGTTLRIYLPRAESTTNGSGTAKESEGRETILVIEDDRLVRRMIREGLEHRGYRVLEAGSVAAALRHCRDYPDAIDLVLTDVVLPGMSGPEAIRNIRLRHPEVRAVFMSGGGSEDEVATDVRLEVGRNFIKKPFDEAHLAAFLRRSLDTF